MIQAMIPIDCREGPGDWVFSAYALGPDEFIYSDSRGVSLVTRERMSSLLDQFFQGGMNADREVGGNPLG